MLFSRNQHINIVYPNENYPFILAFHENKLDSIHGRSLSHFKDKLWFQTKRRLQMLFSRNQRINIVYPDKNYPFFLAPHEKKLDSIQGEVRPILRTNFDSKQNKGCKCFFPETNTSISCMPMRTTYLCWPLMKRN